MVGPLVGLGVGCRVGGLVGAWDGLTVGVSVGAVVGATTGDGVGALVGDAVGRAHVFTASQVGWKSFLLNRRAHLVSLKVVN